MQRKLPDAMVYRGGITARQLTQEFTQVQVRNPAPGGGVCSTFTLPSKGGGTISIQFGFGSGSYEAILQTMLENDRKSALASMAKLLAEDLANLPKREVASVRAVRKQLLDAAKKRQRAADGMDEAIATIVCDKLHEIVKDLEEEEEAKASQ